MNKIIKRVTALLVSLMILLSCISIETFAEDSNGEMPVVMVSLGDSYASGESITPFYGQEKALNDKVQDEDWLAHRSTKSWAAMLKIPGVSGTMGNYKTFNESSRCKWYFQAVSGAQTIHLKDEKQKKEYFKDPYPLSAAGALYIKAGEKYLPKQLDIFKSISEPVDYVTLSIGGNDVNFADIITDCVTGSTYLGSKKLDKRLDKLWDNIGTTKTNLLKAYRDIHSAAGAQAEIIVTGYPKLLEKNGKGVAISKKEAETVNENVTKFNNLIKTLVEDCQADGMRIHFVDIESEFDKDGGHQAYSSNPWINKVILGAQSEDIDDRSIASAYSIHPNEEGAKAYARCVNKKIEEIASSKKTGMISGKICKASDRTSPINNAYVNAVRESDNVRTSITSNSDGQYGVKVPIGDYRIDIIADGYIGFSAYTTVTENINNYMETFLLVQGSEGATGSASGKIINAFTGTGIGNVSLSVRSGWNNIDKGDILKTGTSNETGDYSFTLPIGNYTVKAEKSGFVAGFFNIIVQEGSTGSQNGTITPELPEGQYRMVLTWGQNPNDLDSHITGQTSSGSSFHVYYSSMNAYDGDTLVANLDVDDTSSYGPETITLTPTTTGTYKYYVHHYAGSGSISTSGAQVKLYKGNTLIGTYNAPTDQGTGIYWTVFEITNGTVKNINKIASSVQ